MPGGVVGVSLGLGYAGKVSRNQANKISARMGKSILDGNGAELQPKIKFGDAVVLNTDNTYSKFGATGAGVATPTAANFAGLAVAEVKQAVTYPGSNGDDGYVGGQAVDVMTEGTMTVFCKEGAPVAGGAVYIVTTESAAPVSKVGDLIATATPAGGGAPATVLLPQLKWTTGKIDANKIAEVSIMNMVNP